MKTLIAILSLFIVGCIKETPQPTTPSKTYEIQYSHEGFHCTVLWMDSAGIYHYEDVVTPGWYVVFKAKPGDSVYLSTKSKNKSAHSVNKVTIYKDGSIFKHATGDYRAPVTVSGVLPE